MRSEFGLVESACYKPGRLLLFSAAFTNEKTPDAQGALAPLLEALSLRPVAYSNRGRRLVLRAGPVHAPECGCVGTRAPDEKGHWLWLARTERGQSVRVLNGPSHPHKPETRLNPFCWWSQSAGTRSEWPPARTCPSEAN